MLPSGDLIWVRVQGSRASRDRGGGRWRCGCWAGTADYPGCRGVVPARIRGDGSRCVASVRQAIDEHRPDSLTVEFAIEITARTGALLSVLAEAGGTAQVKVTASWDRRDAPAPPPGKEEGGPT